MDAAPYRTVAGRGESAHSVRGSRFLGTVAHVTSKAAAESEASAIQTGHPDATHVVPAYRIRGEPLIEYASDDGEPTNSAGKPMLTVLQGQELENVVAVVVRYYGGTNLGIGGLVRSYQEAVKAAIDDAGVLERRPRSRLVVETTYDDSGTVRGILEGSDAEFSASYEESVRFTVAVPIGESESLVDRLRDATSGRVTIAEP